MADQEEHSCKACTVCSTVYDERIQTSLCPHHPLEENAGRWVITTCALCQDTKSRSGMATSRTITEAEFVDLCNKVAEEGLVKSGWMRIANRLFTGWMCPICVGILRIKRNR